MIILSPIKRLYAKKIFTVLHLWWDRREKIMIGFTHLICTWDDGCTICCSAAERAIKKFSSFLLEKFSSVFEQKKVKNEFEISVTKVSWVREKKYALQFCTDEMFYFWILQVEEMYKISQFFKFNQKIQNICFTTKSMFIKNMGVSTVWWLANLTHNQKVVGSNLAPIY